MVALPCRSAVAVCLLPALLLMRPSMAESGSDEGLTGTVFVSVDGDLILNAPSNLKGRVLLNGMDVIAEINALKEEIRVLQVCRLASRSRA